MFQLNIVLRNILLGIVIFILVIILAYNFLFQKFKVTGESIECFLDAPIPFNYTCKLNKNNDDDIWTFEGNIPEGIEIPDMMATVTTYHFLNDSTYEAVYLKNTTINVCKYSGGLLATFLIDTYLPGLPGRSNLNKPCPFKGKIFVDNFQMMPSLPLPRVLSGKWIIDMVIYMSGFNQFSFHIKVIVEAKPTEWKFF